MSPLCPSLSGLYSWDVEDPLLADTFTRLKLGFFILKFSIFDIGFYNSIPMGQWSTGNPCNM